MLKAQVSSARQKGSLAVKEAQTSLVLPLRTLKGNLAGWDPRATQTEMCGTDHSHAHAKRGQSHTPLSMTFPICPPGGHSAVGAETKLRVQGEAIGRNAKSSFPSSRNHLKPTTQCSSLPLASPFTDAFYRRKTCYRYIPGMGFEGERERSQRSKFFNSRQP